MRTPLDALPQRRLVDLLRVEIDASMLRGSPSQRLLRLVASNPRSVWSGHVLYNIGMTRASWLAAAFETSHARTRATSLPVRREPVRSFVRSRQ